MAFNKGTSTPDQIQQPQAPSQGKKSFSQAPAPASPGQDVTGFFTSGFSGTPYADSPAFQNLIQQFTSDPNRTLMDQGNAANWQNIIKGYGDTFASQFQNLAGRPPTSDEYNTFFSQVVNPMQPWNKTPDQAAVQQGAQGLLKDTFSSTIADAQQKKAQDQANAATAAGTPFDAWSKSMSSSVDNLDKQLQDYQSRLFEKIRPQLLTSLQSQGLLNSGALNEAFAGAASDLTNAETGYVANARLNADQNVANTKYAIQSSPSNFALQNTFNTLPDLTQNGQNALQNAFSNYMNTNMSNMGYQNALNLEQYKQGQNPSLLSQYGGLILGGVAGNATKYGLSKVFGA